MMRVKDLVNRKTKMGAYKFHKTRGGYKAKPVRNKSYKVGKRIKL